MYLLRHDTDAAFSPSLEPKPVSRYIVRVPSEEDGLPDNICVVNFGDGKWLPMRRFGLQNWGITRRMDPPRGKGKLFIVSEILTGDESAEDLRTIAEAT